jgi:hypothetical protein
VIRINSSIFPSFGVEMDTNVYVGLFIIIVFYQLKYVYDVNIQYNIKNIVLLMILFKLIVL